MFLVTILLVLCILAYYFVKKMNYARKYVLPPNYPGWVPIIGHVHLFLGMDQQNLWSYVEEILRTCMQNGGVMKMSLVVEDVFLITDPDDACTIMNTCLEKSYVYKFVESWLGNGLLTAEVPEWRKNRKIMTHAFTHQALVGYMSVFNNQAKSLLKLFDTKIGKAFDPEDFILKNNLETICQTAVGVDPVAHSELLTNYTKALRTVLNTAIERFQKFWLHLNLLYSVSDLRRQHNLAVKDLHYLSNTMLQKRKVQLLDVIHKSESSDTFRPIMDIFLESAIKENLFTDQKIREEVDTIIFGGHDTSTITLTYALLLIGSYQSVQDKAYKEVMEVIGDSPRDLDNVDLSKLVYIDSILKETLRLYPIAAATGRKANSDVKLKNYTIPAGHAIAICVWAIHRHSIWGPDVDDFRPERWLDPVAVAQFSKAFYGFSYGKRGCIGKTYAMMSMKTTLANVIRRYKITADISKLKIKFNGFLRPVYGNEINIQLRK